MIGAKLYPFGAVHMPFDAWVQLASFFFLFLFVCVCVAHVSV